MTSTTEKLTLLKLSTIALHDCIGLILSSVIPGLSVGKCTVFLENNSNQWLKKWIVSALTRLFKTKQDPKSLWTHMKTLDGTKMAIRVLFFMSINVFSLLHLQCLALELHSASYDLLGNTFTQYWKVCDCACLRRSGGNGRSLWRAQIKPSRSGAADVLLWTQVKSNGTGTVLGSFNDECEKCMKSFLRLFIAWPFTFTAQLCQPPSTRRHQTVPHCKKTDFVKASTHNIHFDFYT